MVDLSKYPEFKHIETLKETSKDKHNREIELYMTESNKEVINFDAVKEEYIKGLRLTESPKSNDALFSDGKGNVIFVEFKNGYMDKAKQFAVRKKIYDSILIFSDIVSVGIGDMRKYVEYILVYNEEVNKKNPDKDVEKSKRVQNSSSFDNFVRDISELAKEEHVYFGVKIFENYCFKKVHTYNEKEFEGYIENISK